MIDDVRMEDIHEPQAPPDGTWVFQVINGAYRDVKTDHPKAPKKEGFFPVRAVEPIEVEDSDFDIETFSPIFHQIPVFQDSDRWNVKKFLLSLGVTEDEMEGATLEEAAPAAKGRFFTAHSTTAIAEGQDRARTTLKSVAPYVNGDAS